MPKDNIKSGKKLMLDSHKVDVKIASGNKIPRISVADNIPDEIEMKPT